MNGGMDRFDAATGWRWIFAAQASLGRCRRDIDALNVFPVPDGDTGTNLYLTLRSAIRASLAAGISDADASLSETCTTLALEALLSARGNSGMIVSQILRGFAETVADDAEADERGLDGAGLARAFDHARLRARESVGAPVEGTILSVADAAADAAAETVRRAGEDTGEQPGAAAVCEAALAAAKSCLARTPDLLPSLGRAGVVDAGGAGLVVILSCLCEALGGRPGALGPWASARLDVGGAQGDADGGSCAVPHQGDISSPAPAYEVVFTLDGLPQARQEALRTDLQALGDSVVVAGDSTSTSVHVHTSDVGAVIEAACVLGRPSRLRVSALETGLRAASSNCAEASLLRPAPARDAAPGARSCARSAVLVSAPGPTLAESMSRAGAYALLPTPGQRISVRGLLHAVHEIPAQDVLLLLDEEDAGVGAETARIVGRHRPGDVGLVRTATVVATLAALAVHESSDSMTANMARMQEAAAACRTGCLVLDGRDEPCLGGSGFGTGGLGEGREVRGYVDGKAVAVSSDVDTAADLLLSHLVGGTTELVTLVSGVGQGDGLADRVARRWARDDLEMVVLPGDEDDYLLLVGVE